MWGARFRTTESPKEILPSHINNVVAISPWEVHDKIHTYVLIYHEKSSLWNFENVGVNLSDIQFM